MIAAQLARFGLCHVAAIDALVSEQLDDLALPHFVVLLNLVLRECRETCVANNLGAAFVDNTTFPTGLFRDHGSLHVTMLQ